MSNVKSYSLTACLNLKINNLEVPLYFQSITDTVGRTLSCDIRDGFIKEIKRYLTVSQIPLLVVQYSTSKSISSCLVLNIYRVNATDASGPDDIELKEVPSLLIPDVANLLSEKIKTLN